MVFHTLLIVAPYPNNWEQFIQIGNELASLSGGNDTRLLASKIKHHQKMFNALYLNNNVDIEADIRNRMLNSLQIIEESLYPINKLKYASIWDLYSSFKGRGIVMAVGKGQFRYAVHGIRFLRSILNCKLPIEVFYNGPDDLPKQMIDTFHEISLVSVINAADLISGKNSITGWAIKPLSMAMSSFQEIIFIDADVLFFQNPDILFSFKYYRAAGTLYFRDRTILLEKEWDLFVNYFKQMVPNPSEYAKAQRLLNRLTAYECDSGVVVMDKKRGGLFVLLMATILNMDPFKDGLYKSTHGDKESFWMANEALDVQYRWANGAGGAIGIQHPFSQTAICGSLYHADENWNPFWFNGGLNVNKHTEFGRKNVMRLTHYAIDRSFTKLAWIWEGNKHPFCVSFQNPEQNVGALTSEYLMKGKVMGATWISLNQEFDKKGL